MTQYDDRFKETLEKSLNNHDASVSFNSVWSRHEKDRKKIYKRVIAAPVTLMLILSILFTVGFASYGIMRIVDKTDYPFVNDQRVIGKWEAVDYVDSIAVFKPGEKQWGEELYLKSIAFIRDGRMLTAFEKDKLAYSGENWTKDLIINKQEKTASKYEIREINGQKYMFAEWKSGDYILRNTKPCYFVLKQVDTKDYSDYKVPLIEDKVDYPFVDDQRVIGKWEAVDFIDNIGDFKPGEKQWRDELFLKSIAFVKDGKMMAAMESNELAYSGENWTKDLIISKQDKTASKYEIKEIEGQNYMFMEWKSGDYTYRGAKPCYYVLKQLDSKDYSDNRVPVVEDKVDYPFVNDEQLLGKWEAVDFVETIESFESGKKAWGGALYLTGLAVEEDGMLTAYREGVGTSDPNICWTKGLILEKVRKTAAKYEIKEINGVKYMFFEWKNGDYTYRGMKPWYYVFKKTE